MLAAITLDGRGAADRLLFALAQRLQGDGLRLAGAVQENREIAGRDKPDMVLRLLPDMGERLITQDLGPLSGGCTLDVSALEQVAAEAEQRLPADLVIVNKFGKREADGRGFRTLIAAALAQDIPVLVAVGTGARAQFDSFAGDLVTWLPACHDALTEWAQSQARLRANPAK